MPELIDGIKRNIPEEMIYEIIVVNDGSTDNTEEVVCCIAADDSAVHLISHRKNFGKAAALETGFHESTGGIVITMDADLQDHRDSGPVYSFSHWDSSGSHLSKQIIREEIMIVTSETNKNGDMMKNPVRLLIWGAGVNFQRALPGLRLREERGEIKIIGIVDRNRPENGMINGYPHIMPEDIPGYEFDFLKILSTKYRREILEEYMKIPGTDPCKLSEYIFPELDAEQHTQLVNDRPTIFSSSCWGGLVYFHLGMECVSPFKNLWLHEEDFLSFLQDPRGYMHEDPVPDRMHRAWTKYDEDLYPVLKLGDIKLYCNHTRTMEEAISDWLRRREKINWNFTLAQMSTQNPLIEKRFNLIDTVDRKICMVPYPTTEPYSLQLTLKAGEEDDWAAIVNATAFPHNNPIDIYSLFHGEWKDNPCYEPASTR